MDEEESFFDLLSRFQSKRMDDQRCSLTVLDNKENQQQQQQQQQLNTHRPSLTSLGEISSFND